jgi:histidine triad (HIT) family protein
MIVDQDCVFCKIVAGLLPAYKLHEDEATLAFMDINPISPGHCLVIPKTHFANVFDGTDAPLAAVMAATRRVAIAVRDAMQPDGINLFQANGPAAGQTVFHFHMHILPRRTGDGLLRGGHGLHAGDKAVIAANAEKIRARL